MGPSFALIIVMFIAIAGSILVSLLLMPGWKSSLALIAVYVALLTYVSLSPQLIEGQMERATLGLGWIAVALAAIVRLALVVAGRRKAAKTVV